MVRESTRRSEMHKGDEAINPQPTLSTGDARSYATVPTPLHLLLFPCSSYVQITSSIAFASCKFCSIDHWGNTNSMKPNTKLGKIPVQSRPTTRLQPQRIFTDQRYKHKTKYKFVEGNTQFSQIYFMAHAYCSTSPRTEPNEVDTNIILIKQFCIRASSRSYTYVHKKLISRIIW